MSSAKSSPFDQGGAGCFVHRDTAPLTALGIHPGEMDQVGGKIDPAPFQSQQFPPAHSGGLVQYDSI